MFTSLNLFNKTLKEHTDQNVILLLKEKRCFSFNKRITFWSVCHHFMPFTNIVPDVHSKSIPHTKGLHSHQDLQWLSFTVCNIVLFTSLWFECFTILLLMYLVILNLKEPKNWMQCSSNFFNLSISRQINTREVTTNSRTSWKCWLFPSWNFIPIDWVKYCGKQDTTG